jgi:hypothetical protein
MDYLIPQLIEKWRRKADVNEKTPLANPQMAADLKQMALIYADARRECADELEAVIFEE